MPLGDVGWPCTVAGDAEEIFWPRGDEGVEESSLVFALKDPWEFSNDSFRSEEACTSKTCWPLGDGGRSCASLGSLDPSREDRLPSRGDDEVKEPSESFFRLGLLGARLEEACTSDAYIESLRTMRVNDVLPLKAMLCTSILAARFALSRWFITDCGPTW